MNQKWSEWLKKEIKPLIKPRPRRAPTVWEIRFGKFCRVLLLLLLMAALIWRMHLHFEVKKKIAAIRTAGLPSSPAELDFWYHRIPDSSNAAPLLSEAFALFKNLPGASSNMVREPKLIDRREHWSEHTRKLIEHYVATNSRSLAKAQEAVQRPACRYPVDFSYGLETKLPHLENLKNLAHLSALRALLAAENGQVSNSKRDVILILQLAKTLEQEPILISQLVRLSLITIAVRTVERSFDLGASAVLSADLAAAFANSINTDSFRRAMIGERASAIPVFRLNMSEAEHREDPEPFSDTKTNKPLSGRPNPIIWLTGFSERDLNFYLMAMGTNVALASMSPQESLAATNVEREFTQKAEGKYYLYSSILMPAIARTFTKNATVLTRIQLVKVALSLDRFRVQTGQLPENLNQLTPQFLKSIPIDPFAGEPLRYRRLEKGYVIYSVDKDGHDDGGREKPLRVKSNDKTSYDVTFTVER